MRDRFNERYIAAIKADCMHECCMEGGFVKLSKADTFIEYCFEMACAHMNRGLDVLTEWRYRKDQYCKITDTIVYDFAHYSKHDSSHSVSILETIELVIGDERIVKLSRGDLWLLLESAYSHDIGMALTGEELYNLWSNPDFKEYLLFCLASKDTDLKKAANYYQKMDDLLRNRISRSKREDGKQDDIFEECWPNKIVEYVRWLVSDYIRRQHSKRNAKVRERVVAQDNSEVPKRLYEIVTLVSKLHTFDGYDAIMERLRYREKGIGAELIYPRFTAAMLRLGDVLDVENNRFSLYSVEHMSQMPEESSTHMLKHEAISHIIITPEEIQVEAESDQIEVCQCAQDWFHLIEREVQDLIYSWNEIAPPLLRGCTLKRSQCYVYLLDSNNKKHAYHLERQRRFEVDKEKLTDLLAGANFYSYRMDFIREYLQNAMDATRIQLWEDITQGMCGDEIMKKAKERVLQPFDIPKEIYDRYEVKLGVDNIPGDFENLLITVEDRGIGMEKECVDVISIIGTGWRGRRKYDRVIQEMPRWMRPTGGFGIGIQAAFMVTSSVVIMTQTENEPIGRKITLNAPKSGGEITTEEYQLGHHGTKIELKVPIDIFLRWNSEIAQNAKNKIIFDHVDLEMQKIDDNKYADNVGLDEYNIKNYTKKVLLNYLKQIIPLPLISIVVYVQGYSSLCYSVHEVSYKTRELTWNDKKYLVLTRETTGDSFQGLADLEAWDCAEEVFVTFKRRIYGENGKTSICYKNVRMTGEESPLKALNEVLDISLDFMGLQVKRDLKIHRNEFRESFPLESYVVRYLQLYLHMLLKNRDGFDPKISLLQMIYINDDDRELFKEYIKKHQKEFEDKTVTIYQCVIQQKEWSPEMKEKLKRLDNMNEQRENNDNSPSFNLSDISLAENTCSLLEIYKQYLQMKEGHRGILVASDDRISYTAEEAEGYLYTELQAWIINNMHLKGDQWKFNEKVERNEKNSVFYCLIQNGIVKDNFLWKLLQDKETLSKKKISTYIHNEIKKDKRVIFWKFESKQLIGKNFNSCREFYLRSWSDLEGNFYTEYPEEFASLEVTDLPYVSKQIDGQMCYVIRPMTGTWIYRFNQRNSYNKNMGRSVMTKGEFIKEVMGEDCAHPTEEFGYLMRWVTKYATHEETRKSIHLVWDMYKKYVGGIFDENIEDIAMSGKYTWERFVNEMKGDK